MPPHALPNRTSERINGPIPGERLLQHDGTMKSEKTPSLCDYRTAFRITFLNPDLNVIGPRSNVKFPGLAAPAG